jgi:NCS1 family nucleobase:cation symporter-1
LGGDGGDYIGRCDCNVLVNLTGKPSVKYGIPFPAMVRASMGVRGANLPAMLRAIVGIFWYGVQTYFASTAVTLLITAFVGAGSGSTFLGLSGVAWISFVIVWLFQIAIFWQGIERIKHFLNWAGPLVYVVMLVLMAVVWYQAGSELIPAIGSIFSGGSENSGSAVAAFMAIVGTMVAALTFFAALLAFGGAALFSLSTVLVPALSSLGGYGWLIGAGLGGLFYYGLMRQFKVATTYAEQ